MDSRTQRGLELFAAALVLGVLGDHLLRAAPWGLNACLWLGALLATGCGLVYRWRADLVRTERWFLVPVCALVLLYLGRDAALLKLATTGGVLAALAFGVRRGQLAHWRAHERMVLDPPGLLSVGVRALFRLPRFLVREIDWRRLPAEGRGPQMAAIGRGLFIAAPLLVLFGALFAAADAVFEALVARVLDINVAEWPGHLFWIGLLAWLVGGFLYGLLCPFLRRLDEEGETAPRKRWVSLGSTEVGVVLGLTNMLFAAFVVVQLSYLFGGIQTVLETVDLTVAAYARRGFFELVLVASLALPLLLGLRRLLATKDGRGWRLYHGLAGLQVGLLFLILASAAQRMWLYQQTFGLTELRLYVFAFLVWLAFVLVWFMTSILRDRTERFVPGTVAAGFVVLLGLHALNPDALIVKTNVARAAEGAVFDAAYAAGLSADAVPALLDAVPSLPPETRHQVARHLLARWGAPDRADWRTWSRSRVVARRAVEAHAATLHTLAHREVP